MLAGRETQRIALITHSGAPQLTEDDELLGSELSERGYAVDAVSWDQADADWPSYDAVVLRSCWNYHLEPSKFVSWLNTLKACAANMWNPIDLVHWNLRKHYLLELQEQGILVPPTVILQEINDRSLKDTLAKNGWERAVLKPTISASAFRTRLFSAKDAAEIADSMNEKSRPQAYMVQPFLEEIEKDGEWSFIYFVKQFSHCVLKKAAPGDFRVQSQFGGTVEPRLPPPALLEDTRSIVETVPGNLLYARVDGIERNGRFMLMELEIIEPALFLSTEAEAARRFADAIEEICLRASVENKIPI